MGLNAIVLGWSGIRSSRSGALVLAAVCLAGVVGVVLLWSGFSRHYDETERARSDLRGELLALRDTLRSQEPE